MNLGDVFSGLCGDVVHVKLSQQRQVIDGVGEVVTEQSDSTRRVCRRPEPDRPQRHKLRQVRDVLIRTRTQTVEDV